MEEAHQRGNRPGMEESLTVLLGYPVRVAFTNNKRSIISVRSRGRTYSVRLHHMFMDADQCVIESLASFIFKRSRKNTERLNAFIRQHSEKIEATEEGSRKRATSLITEGEHFSLHHCYAKLNRLFFNGTLDCKITWGVRRRRQGRIKVRLGSYCPEKKVIRINPVLDRAFVPPFVLESVVYHEMVHHFIGMRNKNGRLLSHHQAFREVEQSFPLWEKATLWIKENLHRLLHPK
jgi:predicted SprT family Zn-dependent metalloprotease